MKYYYVIVREKTGELLCNSYLLPIYWRKEAATYDAKKNIGCVVKKIKIKELKNLLNNG